MRWIAQIAYDGTDFSGCPELQERRTVCGELRRALDRAQLGPGLVETLSRTDAGVHAHGNVAHLDLQRPVSAAQLLAVLSRHLPEDLRAHRAKQISKPPVVVDKMYRYTLDLHPYGDPALARTAWRLPGPIDRSRLEPLASRLVGRHDFEAFRRSDETRESLVRAIDEAEWRFDGHAAHLWIRGSAFVYQLVRALVGAMVMVARGGASAEDLVAALAGQVTGVSRQTAPAKGLCLVHMRLDSDWAEG